MNARELYFASRMAAALLISLARRQRNGDCRREGFLNKIVHSESYKRRLLSPYPLLHFAEERESELPPPATSKFSRFSDIV
jgi:hypothetical protein